jgi:DNA-binding response OmpR family regulator
MKILIAEDDVFFCKLLHKLLSPEFEVKTAWDGLEAWHILQEGNAPPLAVLDWVMPGMTGPQICRELRANPGTAGTYAILLTARNSAEDIVAGLRSGADDYVTKPVQPEELRARVAVGRRIVELQANLAAQAKMLAETMEREKSLQSRLISFQDLGQLQQVGGFFRNPR